MTEHDAFEQAFKKGYDTADKMHNTYTEWLQSQLNDCKNELCLKCGNRKEEHLGACNDCRWR